MDFGNFRDAMEVLCDGSGGCLLRDDSSLHCASNQHTLSSACPHLILDLFDCHDCSWTSYGKIVEISTYKRESSRYV